MTPLPEVAADGLYQVTWRGICAGFVIANGKIINAAPWIWRNQWALKIAKRISD